MTTQDTAAITFPAQGGYIPKEPRYATYVLDFTNAGTLQNIDLQQEQTRGGISFIQSVYIDNSGNASTLTLTFGGTGQIIVAQPYSQGEYPVRVPTGVVRFKAVTTQGIRVPVIFSNMPPQGVVWGPVPGANIVPALTNLPIDIAAATIGDNILVPGVAATTIKVYRMFYLVGGAANIILKDSAGNKWTGTLTQTPAGGSGFQASGVPWFTCAVGADLILNSSAAVEIGGQVGYVQD